MTDDKEEQKRLITLNELEYAMNGPGILTLGQQWRTLPLSPKPQKHTDEEYEHKERRIQELCLWGRQGERERIELRRINEKLEARIKELESQLKESRK